MLGLVRTMWNRNHLLITPSIGNWGGGKWGWQGTLSERVGCRDIFRPVSLWGQAIRCFVATLRALVTNMESTALAAIKQAQPLVPLVACLLFLAWSWGYLQDRWALYNCCANWIHVCSSKVGEFVKMSELKITSAANTDTECNHTLLKMRILAFLPINPCSST